MEEKEMPQEAIKEPLSAQSIEALKAELDVLRDVYVELRSEIRNDEKKVTDNITYTVAAVGATVALTGLLVATEQYVLLLTLPFIFFVLAFVNYGYHLGIFQLSGYLTTAVYPRIRRIIVELHGGWHDFGAFGEDWELYRRRVSMPQLVTIPLAGSTFGLHLLFGPLPVVLFFYYKQASAQSINGLEVALLAIDVAGFLILLAYLVAFRRISTKRSKELLSQDRASQLLDEP